MNTFARSLKTLSLCALLASSAVYADRASDVVTAISDWNSWLSSADRTAKYCKMAASPFIFYRGSNHLFWDDFAGDSRLNQFGSSDTRTWLQGDLHAYNFGAYDNDNGTVIYDFNDFDESMVADYQYDVWRMAASLVLIARENGDLSRSSQETMIDAFSEAYLDAMAAYRGNNNETTTEFTKSNTYGQLDDFLADVAAKNSRAEMLDEWTVKVSGVRKFNLTLSDFAAASSSEKSALIAAMASYGTTLSGGLSYSSAYFKVKDIARRLDAGTGSLGTPRYYMLIEGASSSQDDDRILDIKRQGKPTPYVYLGSSAQQTYNASFYNDAQRHALAYLATTAHTDDHLGWMLLSDGAYSVRERSPFKKSFDTVALDSTTSFNNLAEQWGTVMATAHARADQDFSTAFVSKSVDKQIDDLTNGYHSQFRSLVRSIAFSYADQVESDWQVFVNQLAPTCP